MGSKMRSETYTNFQKTAMPDNKVLRLMYKALLRRKTLIHGKLDIGNRSCAVGTFWKDNPDVAINTDFLDEIAAVNDAVPKATQQERWTTVVAWVEWKLNTLQFK